jgi:hypothetical protein
VKAVNHAHQCIVLDKYSSVVIVGERLENDVWIKQLFKSWFGATIHQKMNGKYASCLQCDEEDYGHSCLVLWEEYEGGDLVWVQLGIKVEL